MRVRSIRCANAGFAFEGETIAPLLVTGVATDHPPLAASVRGGVPAGGFPLGQEFFVDVTWHPGPAGPLDGVVSVESPSAAGGAVRVEVRGSRSGLPPCTIEVAPDSIDFGVVAREGAGASISPSRAEIWSYDPATTRIVFTTIFVPREGSIVEVAYRRACMP